MRGLRCALVAGSSRHARGVGAWLPCGRCGGCVAAGRFFNDEEKAALGCRQCRLPEAICRTRHQHGTGKHGPKNIDDGGSWPGRESPTVVVDPSHSGRCSDQNRTQFRFSADGQSPRTRIYFAFFCGLSNMGVRRQLTTPAFASPLRLRLPTSISKAGVSARCAGRIFFDGGCK